MRRFTLTSLLLIAGFNCVTTEGKIRSVASRNFNCPESDIKVKNLKRGETAALKYKLAGAGREQYAAAGCGQRDNFVQFCSDDASPKQCEWLSVASIQEKALRKRAGFDLRCDAESLEILPLDDSTRGVSGCGHRVTYVWNCPHDPAIYTPKCSWILNSDSTQLIQPGAAPVAPAPPAAPPPVGPPAATAPQPAATTPEPSPSP